MHIFSPQVFTAALYVLSQILSGSGQNHPHRHDHDLQPKYQTREEVDPGILVRGDRPRSPGYKYDLPAPNPWMHVDRYPEEDSQSVSEPARGAQDRIPILSSSDEQDSLEGSGEEISEEGIGYKKEEKSEEEIGHESTSPAARIVAIPKAESPNVLKIQKIEEKLQGPISAYKREAKKCVQRAIAEFEYMLQENILPLENPEFLERCEVDESNLPDVENLTKALHIYSIILQLRQEELGEILGEEEEVMRSYLDNYKIKWGVYRDYKKKVLHCEETPDRCKRKQTQIAWQNNIKDQLKYDISFSELIGSLEGTKKTLSKVAEVEVVKELFRLSLSKGIKELEIVEGIDIFLDLLIQVYETHGHLNDNEHDVEEKSTEKDTENVDLISKQTRNLNQIFFSGSPETENISREIVQACAAANSGFLDDPSMQTALNPYSTPKKDISERLEISMSNIKLHELRLRALISILNPSPSELHEECRMNPIFVVLVNEVVEKDQKLQDILGEKIRVQDGNAKILLELISFLIDLFRDSRYISPDVSLLLQEATEGKTQEELARLIFKYLGTIEKRIYDSKKVNEHLSKKNAAKRRELSNSVWAPKNIKDKNLLERMRRSQAVAFSYYKKVQDNAGNDSPVLDEDCNPAIGSCFFGELKMRVEQSNLFVCIKEKLELLQVVDYEHAVCEKNLQYQSESGHAPFVHPTSGNLFKQIIQKLNDPDVQKMHASLIDEEVYYDTVKNVEYAAKNIYLTIRNLPTYLKNFYEVRENKELQLYQTCNEHKILEDEYNEIISSIKEAKKWIESNEKNYALMGENLQDYCKKRLQSYYKVYLNFKRLDSAHKDARIVWTEDDKKGETRIIEMEVHDLVEEMRGFGEDPGE